MVYTSSNTSTTIDPVPTNFLSLIGDKHFELSNHLGNVLAVISDKKIPTATAGVFNPDVLSYSDYYPFGMLVPNRHSSNDSYRYGFNGKELDNELKGEGNSYNFGARMLDPRIGRWFAPDKMEEKYPSTSPYVAFADNPVFFIDPDGNEIAPWKWFRSIFGFRIGTSYSITDHYDSDTKFDKTYTSMMSSSRIYRRIVGLLQRSSRTYKFSSTYNSSTSADKAGEYGHFDPKHQGTKTDPYTINFMVDYKSQTTHADDKGTLFEETFHAAQNDYAIKSKSEISNLATEVEAKLVKNIEGFSQKEEGVWNYDVIEFEGSKEIFNVIKSGKKLSVQQKDVLSNQIQILAKNVSKRYGNNGQNNNYNHCCPIKKKPN